MRIITGIRNLRRPTILGAYLAGEIESVGGGYNEGGKVTRCLRRVAFDLVRMLSTYVYRAQLRWRSRIKPANMTYEEAAAIPIGDLNALHFLKKGKYPERRKGPD